MTELDCTDPATWWPHVDEATRALAAGGLVVLPTDTVYGIAADAFKPQAVQALLDAKGRGRQMPPPVLIGDVRTLDGLADDVPDTVREMIGAHWPGPLTVILKAQPSLQWDLGETHGTVALRMPDHELTLAVLRRTGPLAVSSANTTGSPAATTAAQAASMLGTSVRVYLDGGTSPGGVASTIVDATGPALRIVREGALTAADLGIEEPAEAEPDSADATASTSPSETAAETEVPPPAAAHGSAGDADDVAIAPRRVRARSKTAATAAEADESTPAPAPKPRRTRATSAAASAEAPVASADEAAAPAAKPRRTRASSAAAAEAPTASAEETTKPAPKPRRTRASSAASAAAPAASADETTKPAPKPRRTRATSAASAAARGASAEEATEPAPKPRRTRAKAATPVVAEVEPPSSDESAQPSVEPTTSPSPEASGETTTP